MQRGALRATVGGVAVDIPIGTFATGQSLRYNATGGPGSTPIIDSAAGGDVVGPVSSTDNHIALFNGATGKLLKDTSPIVVAVGVVTGVTSVNGADPGAHAARHNPGGADAMFPGSWANGDQAQWNGSAWVPNQQLFGLNTATQVLAVTTLADVTGHTFSLRSGFTYWFRFRGAYRSNATTTGLRFTANYGGTSSSYSGSLDVFTSTSGGHEYFSQTTLNTAMGSGSGPGAADVAFEFWGNITTTSAATFAFRIASEVAVASGITLAARCMSQVWQQ